MTATIATRTARIRDMVAFALDLADSIGVEPTSCGADVTRTGGRWSSLSVWFATPDDMRRFVRALTDENEGEYTEQGEGARHLRGWCRDAYNVTPIVPGEDCMYVRLVAHDDQTAAV